MARTANGKADTSDVAAQIDTIKADIATLTNLIGEMATSKKDEARSAATSAAAKLKASAADQATLAQLRAMEMGEKVRDSAVDTYAQTEDAIRKQPAMAVGIAAGVGFLVGLLATRR
ncbi:MAG: YqjD family protein [Tateyamaria sp.]